MDRLDAICEESLKKREHANQLLEMWSKIFRSFMDPRTQKRDGMRWKDYFRQILDAEVVESPSWALSSDLSSEDAAIQVGVFLASLKKRVASATASVNHYNLRKSKKIEREEKFNARQEKKLKAALEKPQEQQEKRERQKHLVSIASVSLTWHPVFR